MRIDTLTPTPTPELMPWEIAAAEEARLVDVMRSLADEWVEIGGLTCASGGPGSWLSQAVGASFEVPLDREAVEAIVAFYTARACEPKVCVTPYTHPSAFESLAAAGFGLRVVEQVLTLDLAAWKPPVFEAPADLWVVPVDPGDAAQVGDFVRVHCAGFYGDAATPALAEAARRSVFHPRAVCYLAGVGTGPGAGVGTRSGAGVGTRPGTGPGAEVVAVAAYETFGPLATLFGVTVLPAWRGRGIQTALLHHRLRAVRERGLAVATISSLPRGGTERNAVRAGMRPLFGRLELVRPGPGLVPAP